MTIVKAKKIYVFDLADFVREFYLKNEFEHEYGISIEKWERDGFDITDEEAIIRMLDKMKGEYIVSYEGDVDGFVIYKLK